MPTKPDKAHTACRTPASWDPTGARESSVSPEPWSDWAPGHRPRGESPTRTNSSPVQQTSADGAGLCSASAEGLPERTSRVNKTALGPRWKLSLRFHPEQLPGPHRAGQAQREPNQGFVIRVQDTMLPIGEKKTQSLASTKV